MLIHLIEGELGCLFARDHRAVTVIVDALRASATAAALLHAGANEILAVREVGEAFEARREWRDALLYGERGGLPPEGFDWGNSPADAVHAAGRQVIFTTTTGAGRLIEAWGAAAVFMGTAVNVTAVILAALTRAKEQGSDLVIVPAGLMGDPEFDAQEDWAAAAFLARHALIAAGPMSVEAEIGAGLDIYMKYALRLDREGLESLFQTAPHAEKLRGIGKESDISLCAATDTFGSVPMVAARHPLGVILRRG
jgi:2-phosphosulfolactate phosphatase